MKPTRILTIKGRTMPAQAWALQPGAVRYWTILNRLNTGWSHQRAVFFPIDARRSAGAKKSQRKGRGSVPYAARPAVDLPPAPRVINPHPPRWGGFASYPIESLPLLRRIA